MTIIENPEGWKIGATNGDTLEYDDANPEGHHGGIPTRIVRSDKHGLTDWEREAALKKIQAQLAGKPTAKPTVKSTVKQAAQTIKQTASRIVHPRGGRAAYEARKAWHEAFPGEINEGICFKKD